MKTHTPKNTEIFKLSASDFLTAEDGSWQDDMYRAKLAEDKYAEMNETAEPLAGFYWWTCCPGCMPDSEASGPFATWEEANKDAGGGEYEDDVYALAMELAEDPADIAEEWHECYGMKVLSVGSAEYAVGTDEEADEAWDQSLDSYLDDCGVLDSMPDNLRPYFDREAWKRDAKMDGRGHSLASYDGHEIDLADGYVAFRIN